MPNILKKFKTVMGIGAIAAAILVPSILIGHSYFVSDTVVTKINGTEVKRYEKSDVYLVFTDAGVFQNSDAWYRLKWNSSDLQNRVLKLKDKQVAIQKYGWRMPFFSAYENIVDIKEVKD